MKARTTVIAIAAAAAVTLAGCSGSGSGASSSSSGSATSSGESSSSAAPASNATLDIALAGPIDSWNPQEAVALTSYSVFPQVFASLLSTSPDGSVLESGLASEYQYDGTAKTITFTLDPAAKFSDGSDVSAKDVLFSFDLWKNGQIYGAYFNSVKSVTAVSDDVVKFTMKQPDSSILGILATANAAVVPEKFGGKSAEEFWKRPISAAAYAISDETQGESITLTSNTYYTKNANRPSTVKYAVVADAAQQLLQFQNGDVDVVNTVELSSAGQFDSAQLQSTASSGNSVIVFQTKTAPFDKLEFRQAVNLAIDKAALLAGGYAGLASATNTVLPAIVPGVAPCAECNWATSNVEEAKKLVTASGYDGRKIKLLVGSEAGPDKLAAEAVVPMLAAVGINVTVEPLPLASYFEKLSGGNFEMGILNYNAAAPSASDPLGFLASTGNLFSQSDPAAAAGALEAVAAASTEDAIKQATSGFEKWAFENMPIIPLSNPNAIYAVSPKVQGFVANHYRTWRAENVTVTE